MSLISLWSRARHAVKRERNKPVANRCAHTGNWASRVWHLREAQRRSEAD